MSGFISCRKDFYGSENANGNPQTYIAIDTIIRLGGDRLTSQVSLYWWGDDADGFITGYEFTFDDSVTDATIWQFTGRQDSIFTLAPGAGEDTADYILHIRAVDNMGLKDATPARLRIPVKNSPPTVTIIPGINNPVQSFPVLKYYWSASDPDGDDNIAYYELYFNDTTASPYVLDGNVSSAIFQAQDPAVMNFVCSVYVNSNSIAEENTISGLTAYSDNTLYIRSVDLSGAASSFASAAPVYVKPVTGNVLLVDGYSASSPVGFYHDQLASAGILTADTIRIFEQSGGQYTQQSADNITQARIFDLFDLIIWFSNDADNSFSLAQKTTTDFFAHDGKMLMSVYISSSFDPLSNFLDFTPVAALTDPPDTTLILEAGGQLIADAAGYPELQGTAIIGIVKPFILQLGAASLYKAELTAKDNTTLALFPWTGNSTVIAKKTDAGGQTNFVLSALELQKLDGLGTMPDFFQKVIINEFGF